MNSTLSYSDNRIVRNLLSDAGLKMPAVGYAVRIPGTDVAVCRDARGYFLAGGTLPGIQASLAHGNLYLR